MKKKILFLFSFLLFACLFIFTKNVYAATCTVSPNPYPNDGTTTYTRLTFTISGDSLGTSEKYYGKIQPRINNNGPCSGTGCQSDSKFPESTTSITFTWNSTSLTDTTTDAYAVSLFDLFGALKCQAKLSITSAPPPPDGVLCSASGVSGAECQVPPAGENCKSGYKRVQNSYCAVDGYECCAPDASTIYTCLLHAGNTCASSPGVCSGTLDPSLTCKPGTGTCCVPSIPPPPIDQGLSCNDSSVCCKCTGAQPAILRNLITTGGEDWECIPESGSTSSFRYPPTRATACISPNICSSSGKGCVIPETFDSTVVAPPCDNCTKSINTAFGTIFTEPSSFVRWVLGFVLGLAGGILLLLLILAGYRLMTSQGDPEKVKEAREQVTSAIIGLFFIIFSFVIYQFITSTVLALPGFGK